MHPKWSFTCLLLLVYLGIFHLWMHLPPDWIIGTGFATAALLSVLWVTAARHQHFVNRWDCAFHAAVILDILLEAVLIRRHEHLGFYFCAAAFAVVLVGYRWWFRRVNNSRDF